MENPYIFITPLTSKLGVSVCVTSDLCSGGFRFEPWFTDNNDWSFFVVYLRQAGNIPYNVSNYILTVFFHILSNPFFIVRPTIWYYIVWAIVGNVVLSLDVLERISCVVWNGELFTFGLLSSFFVSHYKLQHSVLLHEMADIMCTQLHIYITVHSSKLHRQELGKWFTFGIPTNFKSEFTTVHTDITLIIFKFKSIVNYIQLLFLHSYRKQVN